MMEDDINKDNLSPENKPISGMAIVGYNILALAIYTLLLKLVAGDAGLIYDAFILAIHVFLCIIMAIAKQSWKWLFSGLVVLVIGFSTCVMIGNMH